MRALKYVALGAVLIVIPSQLVFSDSFISQENYRSLPIVLVDDGCDDCSEIIGSPDSDDDIKANAYMQKHNYSAAIKYYTKAIGQYSRKGTEFLVSRGVALQHRGEAYAALGDPKAALRDYKAAMLSANSVALASDMKAAERAIASAESAQ